MCQGVYGWLISEVSYASNGAQELLNQAKSRCLVLTDGKFQQNKKVYVSKSNIDVSIPCISNQPVRILKSAVAFTVSEKDKVELISSVVSKGLALINKYFNREVYKVWIL